MEMHDQVAGTGRRPPPLLLAQSPPGWGVGAATAARALGSSRSDPRALSLGSQTRAFPAWGQPPGGPTLLSVPAKAARVAGRQPPPPYPRGYSKSGKRGFRGLGPRSRSPLRVSQVSRLFRPAGHSPGDRAAAEFILPMPGDKSAAHSGPLGCARSEGARVPEAPLPTPHQ